MNRTAIKITIAIALVTILLLLIVDIITLRQIQASFNGFLKELEGQGFLNLIDLNEINTHKELQDQFQESLYRSILVVSVFAFFVSILLGFLIASFITRPLRELKKGIQKLRHNNYKYRIAETGDDEVDQVIKEFNNLSKGLEQEEILRKDLVSDVSHEFQTPLTALHGQVQGIRDGIFKPDKNRIEAIFSQIERLSSLVDNLQEYTRMRSSLPNIKIEECSLNKIVEQLLTLQKSNLDAAKINVENKIPKNFKLQADKKMLERVIDNIISNAIKYSKAKTLKFNLKDSILTIEDDGIGIQENDLKSIFERFYRVEKSRSRDSGGLGLGLAIVKEIVDTHGWKIKAESKPKKGTKFIINFSPK
jgi:signal transduction histidine kinase